MEDWNSQTSTLLPAILSLTAKFALKNSVHPRAQPTSTVRGSFPSFQRVSMGTDC